MLKRRFYISYLLLVTLLSLLSASCTKKTEYFESSNAAVKNVIERFPSLLYQSDSNSKSYSKRKVSIENDSIEINLIAFENNKVENEILVFKNKENHYYALPLFTTIHRDYWNFKNDSIVKQVPRVTSTFSHEFATMLRILKFKDRMLFWKLYVETFKTVLDWTFIEKTEDLLSLRNTIYMTTGSSIENEDHTSSLNRIHRNIDELSISFKKHNTYIINGRGILIEFINIDDYLTKNRTLRINCYRQDQIIKLLNL